MNSSKTNNLQDKSTCAIIGSGIAGLASAIRIAAKGYQVDVFEAHHSPGGKLREWRSEGFRFDLGPSVFTLPELVDELFELCGKNPSNYFEYQQLEIPFKYFYEDGNVLTAYADTDLFAQEIESKTLDNRAAFEAYLKDVATKYDITNEVFIENSLHIFTNFLTKKSFSGILNFGKIDAFKCIDAGNKQFFKDPKVVQMMNKCANYVGSNPFIAPATLNVIQHLEVNLGVFLPKGGMYNIVEALVKLAMEMGVKFHFNSLVKRILIEKKAAVGIQLDSGEQIRFDRVVSNMDIYHTYHRLMPDQKQPKRSLNEPKSSSIVSFYWGIDRTFDQLGVHNMLFTNNERKEYEAIFDEKTIADDPSIYIGITSKLIPEDAPKGCENWFALVCAPNHQGQNWDEIVARTRKNTIAKINRMLGTDIEKHIITEHVLTPPAIESHYLSVQGAVYGNSSNNRFSAFLRHPNFSSRINNLYFVGGSVHPGAGVPMCLNSAKIMDKVFK